MNYGKNIISKMRRRLPWTPWVVRQQEYDLQRPIAHSKYRQNVLRRQTGQNMPTPRYIPWQKGGYLKKKKNVGYQSGEWPFDSQRAINNEKYRNEIANAIFSERYSKKWRSAAQSKLEEIEDFMDIIWEHEEEQSQAQVFTPRGIAPAGIYTMEDPLHFQLTWGSARNVQQEARNLIKEE